MSMPELLITLLGVVSLVYLAWYFYFGEGQNKGNEDEME